MDAQLGRHCDGAAEEEEGVEEIEDQRQKGRTKRATSERTQAQVEERQHRENCDKHVVVDDGRVAREGGLDDVADKRHDEESPEELERPQAQIEYLRHHLDELNRKLLE